jgi:hypothetical protein
MVIETEGMEEAALSDVSGTTDNPEGRGITLDL